MTTTAPNDKADAAISAVAVFANLPIEQLKYERSNLLRNMLHIRNLSNRDVFIYSTQTGTVYPPRSWQAAEVAPPF